MPIERSCRTAVVAPRLGLRDRPCGDTRQSLRAVRRRDQRGAQIAGQRLDERGESVRLVGSRDANGRLCLCRLASVVEQQFGEFDAADSVGDRVVHLLDERGASVRQPLDDGELPERSILVECRHRHQPGDVQHRAEVSRLGSDGASQVVVEVEELVELPAWRSQAKRRFDDSLAKPRDQFAGLFESADEPAPVGTAVEHRDGDDRASQARVPLDGPHQGIGFVQPRRELLTRNVLSRSVNALADTAAGAALYDGVHGTIIVRSGATATEP